MKNNISGICGMPVPVTACVQFDKPTDGWDSGYSEYGESE